MIKSFNVDIVKAEGGVDSKDEFHDAEEADEGDLDAGEDDLGLELKQSKLPSLPRNVQ